MCQKFIYAVVVTLFFFVVFVESQDPVCNERPDHWIVEIGCWGYKFCNSSHMVSIVNCSTNGTFLDRETKQCLTSPAQGHSDCGHDMPCKGKADGYYADLGDKCISYYVCAGEVSLGRQYCAAHLIFNEKTSSCDWVNHVLEPCGTMKAETTSPSS